MHHRSSASQRSRKFWAIALSAWLLVSPRFTWSAAGDDLPDFGDISGSLLTPAEEQRLGKAFMRQIRASEPVIEDPLLEDYIKDLGDTLVKYSDGLGSPFTFFLIDER